MSTKFYKSLLNFRSKNKFIYRFDKRFGEGFNLIGFEWFRNLKKIKPTQTNSLQDFDWNELEQSFHSELIRVRD